MNSTPNDMSLRDYFAGQAMQGLIAATGGANGSPEYDPEQVAASAYIMARAMIQEKVIQDEDDDESE